MIAALYVAVAAAGLFFLSWHAINLNPWRAAATFVGTLLALGALTAVGGWLP